MFCFLLSSGCSIEFESMPLNEEVMGSSTTYKSFTGLFSKLLVAANIAKFKMFILAFTFNTKFFSCRALAHLI